MTNKEQNKSVIARNEVTKQSPKIDMTDKTEIVNQNLFEFSSTENPVLARLINKTFSRAITSIIAGRVQSLASKDVQDYVKEFLRDQKIKFMAISYLAVLKPHINQALITAKSARVNEEIRAVSIRKVLDPLLKDQTFGRITQAIIEETDQLNRQYKNEEEFPNGAPMVLDLSSELADLEIASSKKGAAERKE